MNKAEKMDEVRIYDALQESGFTKENARVLIDEIGKRNDDLATKGDLKDLEIKILNRYNFASLFIAALVIANAAFQYWLTMKK